MTKARPAPVLELSTRITGHGSPVIVIHGFTASSEAMGDLVRRLEPRQSVIAVDLPGHGATAPPPAGYRMEDVVRDLGAVFDRTGGPAHLCGYSMGGRVALSFAVARPQQVRSLALIGTSTGIQDEQHRAERARSDEEMAREIELSDMGSFLDTWLEIPLLAPGTARGRRAVQESRLLRTANEPSAIAAALRSLGAGQMPPLGRRLGVLDMPVIAIAGEFDDKYCVESRAIAAGVVNGRVLIVPGAGHAAHLDDPGLVAAGILENIAAAEGGGAS